MKGIELPILWNNEKTAQLAELGIEYEPEETRLCAFYNINGITPYEISDNVWGTAILVNGDVYICPLKYGRVQTRLKSAGYTLMEYVDEAIKTDNQHKA